MLYSDPILHVSETIIYTYNRNKGSFLLKKRYIRLKENYAGFRNLQPGGDFGYQRSPSKTPFDEFSGGNDFTGLDLQGRIDRASSCSRLCTIVNKPMHRTRNISCLFVFVF